MKNFRFSDSVSLLEKISYTKPNELKLLLKYILSSSNKSADVTETCILVDLKTALGLYESTKHLKVLTDKQKKVMVEHIINDKTQIQVATELNITQQGVSILLNSALRRIRDYIVDKEIKWMPWTESEKIYLMQYYGKMNIYKLAGNLKKPMSRVISMYHYLKNLELSKSNTV